MRKMLVLLGVSVLGLLIIITGVQLFQQSRTKMVAKKTSDKFITYILKGDGDDSYNMLTPSAQQNIDRDSWDLQTVKLSAYFAPNQATYQTTTKTNDTYIVTYQIKGIDGPFTLTSVMVNTAQGWQVKLFLSSAGT